MYSAMDSSEICGLNDHRSVVWTETEALEKTRELFDAVLTGVPQRVRMPDLTEILLTLAQTDDDANRSHAYLTRGSKLRREDR